tara:strand:+ start:41 stop:424 length:384 start_codon:yes stop_codon:yes gene_type:complete
MAKKKVSATTKSTKVTKEPVVENKPTPTGYLVSVFVKREPVDKNIPVADIFYKKNSDTITLSCYAPNKEAEIEMIIEGDISVSSESGGIKMISKSESPETWILNLYASNEFSGNPFVASQPEALYEA